MIRDPESWWWAACASDEVRGAPVARRVMGRDVVLFRAGGRLAALEDRCPHRNAPLSAGRVRDETLECGYHGWRFAPDGRCVAVPGLASVPASARAARALPVLEQDGLAWIALGEHGRAPARAPEPATDTRRRDWPSLRLDGVVAAPLARVLENVLDVPHTAFLHGGLFRSAPARDVDVVVRVGGDRAEGEFVGEARPSGWAGRLLAPGAERVRHVDRFVMPSIAQVDYGLGDDHGLFVHHVLTPIDDASTRVFWLVRWRLALPSLVVRPLLRAIARRLAVQDARMLELQSRAIDRAGGERFASTEADVLGGPIRTLLAGGDASGETRVRLRL